MQTICVVIFQTEFEPGNYFIKRQPCASIGSYCNPRCPAPLRANLILVSYILQSSAASPRQWFSNEPLPQSSTYNFSLELYRAFSLRTIRVCCNISFYFQSNIHFFISGVIRPYFYRVKRKYFQLSSILMHRYKLHEDIDYRIK